MLTGPPLKFHGVRDILLIRHDDVLKKISKDNTRNQHHKPTRQAESCNKRKIGLEQYPASG